MHQNLILGYSGNLLAMLFEIMHRNGNRGPFTILKNINDKGITVPPYLTEGVIPSIVEAGEDYVCPEDYTAYFGVYTPWIKQKIFTYFEKKEITQNRYGIALDPSSVIASTALLGNGIQIEPLSVISSYAELSFGVTVNRNSSVGHHTKIGRFASLGPGVNIGGHSVIGDQVQIGIGATVFNNISIGQNSIIGGGSVVTADIPDHVVAWGNPCKVIRPVNNP